MWRALAGIDEVRPLYIPVDEEHPTTPPDAYAMSKVCNEICGRSFHVRSGTDRALAVNGLGYQVFNVANPDSSVDLPSSAVVAEFYTDVPQKRKLGEFETFYSIEKARDMLAFAPQSRWREN